MPEMRRSPFETATRRSLILGGLALPLLPALPGCASPLPAAAVPDGVTLGAKRLLDESAAAHGLAALAGFSDLNLRYEGQWRPFIGRIQPELADPGFRGGSEERLLLREGLVVQAHQGASGQKHVWRQTGRNAQGDVRVWVNGVEARDTDRRAAAALVVDVYSLCLLGPMLLAGRWAAERTLNMDLGAAEVVDGRDCEVLQVRIGPGFGFSFGDRLALCIDRQERLMRRARFSLEGVTSSRGAIAEVDCFDHVALRGVRWPTRYYERLRRPFPLPIHDWRLTGLDIDRGLQRQDLAGTGLTDRAASPAVAFPPTPAG